MARGATLVALGLLAACGSLYGLDDLVYDLGSGGGGAGGNASNVGGAGGSGGQGGGFIGDVTLSDHSKGQTTDKFRGGVVSLADAEMFAFRLEPQDSVRVTGMDIELTSPMGVVAADLTDINLYRDDGSVRGMFDASDTLASSATVMGTTVMLTDEFELTAATDFLLVADVGNLETADRVSLTLAADSIAAERDGAAQSVSGLATLVTHERRGSDLEVNEARLVYGESATNGPRDRRFDSASQTWTSPNPTAAISGEVKWIATPEVLESDTMFAAVLSDTGTDTTLSVMSADADVWTIEWSTNGVFPSDSDKRAFDIAHEAGSNNVMVVYGESDGNPSFRRRVGDAWTTPEQVFASGPGGGTVQWVRLVSRRATNEIALLFGTVQGAFFVSIWDGESETWSDPPELVEATLNRTDFECFAGAYEAQSGDLLVVWGHDLPGVDGFYSASKASGQTTFNAPTLDPDFTSGGVMSLQSEVGTNRIALMQLEHTCGGSGCDNVEAAIWDDTVFLNKTFVQGDIQVPYGSRPGTHPVATSWIGQSGNAVGVYVHTGANGIDWGLWSGSGNWVEQPDAMTTPAFSEPVNVDALNLVTRALFVFSDTNGVLWAKTTTGSAWPDTEGGSALGFVGITTAKPFAAARVP